MRRVILAALLAAFAVHAGAQSRPGVVRFVFTSDAHYGLTRPSFRGRSNVSAHDVNTALVADIDGLGPLDFVAEGGDVANRADAEAEIQPAAVSWRQFHQDYVEHLRMPVYVVPGNHDVSNAIGYHRPMAIDNTSMVGIYNLMMAPRTRTSRSFNYAADRVLTSRDISGVHFVFLTVWPDSLSRAWLARDLEHVSAKTPVVIFTHDQPEAERKHFTNPDGTHDINASDRFENLLCDTYTDDRIAEWETFLAQHPNITAYFHGNSNWNQFYDWTGPRHAVTLHTFRVDSPMKGKDSASDETKLSFHVVTIDSRTSAMTVRERLWNAGRWGAETTVSIAPPASGLTHN